MNHLMYRLFLLTLVAIFVSAQAVSGNTNDAQLETHHLVKNDNCERKARATDVLTVHYKGTLENGEVFDSSYERNEPFSFQLGIGKVILGWEKGLMGTCKGDKLKLVVPPHMGYGDVQTEKIPPKSTLIFEIEVLGIEDGPKPVNVFKEIDVDGDNKLTREEISNYLKKQFQQAREHGDTGTIDDPNQREMVNEIFMHEDRDKDGVITYEEFSGPKDDHDEL